MKQVETQGAFQSLKQSAPMDCLFLVKVTSHLFSFAAVGFWGQPVTR